MKKFLSVLLSLAIFFSISITNVSASSIYGNTNANIKSGGITLKSGGYYYSVDTSSNNLYSYYPYDDDSLIGWTTHSYSIYKKTSSGEIINTLVENALDTPFLNSINGYIYYLGMSTSTGEPGVFRVKTDGTDMQQLATIDLTSYRGSPSTFLPMTIKDNYIYYCPDHFSINKMSLNGTNKKTIYKSPTWIKSFCVGGNSVYINNITNTAYFENSTYNIYKISTNGGSKRCLCSSKYNFVDDIMYYNGYIFYVYTKGNYEYLYRMNSYGYYKKCLLKTSGNINYSIYNNRIYYTYNQDRYDKNESTCLRSCSLSGYYKKVLFRDSHFYILTVSDSIVYVNNLSEIKTYRLY